MDTSIKFREWAIKYKYRLDSDEHGYYINTHTQSAWDAWKAREGLCSETKNTQVSSKTSQD